VDIALPDFVSLPAEALCNIPSPFKDSCDMFGNNAYFFAVTLIWTHYKSLAASSMWTVLFWSLTAVLFESLTAVLFGSLTAVSFESLTATLHSSSQSYVRIYQYLWLLFHLDEPVIFMCFYHPCFCPRQDRQVGRYLL
jgi:hypothetical protein